MAVPRAALSACLIALPALASPVYAQALAGIVVDPQQRRVAAAEVRLVCPGEVVRRTVTDREGAFSFGGQPASDQCLLDVTARGFAPVSQRIGANRAVPRVVRLAVQPIVETIEVHGKTNAPHAAAIDGLTLLGTELATISNEPQEVVRYARARAGSTGDAALYVDGLPSPHLPPVSRIAAVRVDADPFSAEFSDTGARRIEIVTTEPDRRWRVNFGGAPPTLGARDPLSPGSRSRSRSLNGGMSGPLPWSRGSVGFNAGVDDLHAQPAVVAVDPRAAVMAVHSTSRRGLVSLQLQQQFSASTAFRIEGSHGVDRATNAGAGGEVLAEAGSSREAATTALRMSLTHEWPGAVWRNQVLGEWSDQQTTANASTIGIRVPGAFVGGGAPLLSSASAQRQLLWKSLVTSAGSSRQWRAGFTVERASAACAQVPNPAGLAQFSSSEPRSGAEPVSSLVDYYRFGAATTQLMVVSGAAAFGETTLARWSNAFLKGGLRVDWQSGDRALLSPRLSGSGRAGAWTLAAGVGAFTRDWRPEVFLGTARAQGRLPIQLLTRQVPFTELGALIMSPDAIETRVAAGFARARYVMASESAERTLGPVIARVEHVWWRGRHLAGARRLPADFGWIDWLESNRRFDSHELRTHVEAGGPRRNLAFTYSWTRAMDEGDGPYFFPAKQTDLAAERARSARTPAHGIDVVAATRLPYGVRATVIATWRGAYPYNVVTGLDVEGNGLQTDRGGRPRNSGAGPAFRTVSLYVHRRFDLSAISGSRLKIPVDAGAQLDNLFDTRNWTALGEVIGSPLFGRPEAALPGRTLRVWFSVAR